MEISTHPQHKINSTMVIAHRGCSNQAPENVLAAFKKAIEEGCAMMELDTRLSRDGQVVVIHDDDLKRTTNGQGKVADFTLEELKQFDAGSWFGADFHGERIPVLHEVLELAKGRISLDIEIKNGYLGTYTITDLAERVLEEVIKNQMLNQVIFSSFYPPVLKRIRHINPRARISLLYHQSWRFLRQVTKGQPYPVLTLNKSFLTRDKITRIHQHGIKVFAFTVDSTAEMDKLIRWGADGIITNDPRRLIEFIKKM